MLANAIAERALSAFPGIETRTVTQAGLRLPRGLLDMMQALSHMRSLSDVIGIVREQACDIAGADGVSFVLKDGDYCHYVDENAIGPLWKGRRFPLSTCVSGWVMEHKESVAIADIYDDPRVPLDAYKITFVKSLLMVPIRQSQPIGAIGIYWADYHRASDEEIALMQILADSVAIAMENVTLYCELQSKVKQLQESNYELSRFAWVASHDLQEPLRTITTQAELLGRRYRGKLDERAKQYLQTVTGSARRLQHLVEDLLVHSRIEHSEHFKPIVLNEVIKEVKRDIQMSIIESGASITCGELPWIWGEQIMIGRLFQNLISNGIKFRKAEEAPLVHISCMRDEGHWHFMITDNGIGIEPEQCERVFGLFQRVHPQSLYPGSGIGLATCRKIVEMHKGRIWVESSLGHGSTVHVMLPLTGEELVAQTEEPEHG